MKICFALLLATVVEAQVQSNAQNQNDMASKLHFVGSFEQDSYLPTQNTPHYVFEISKEVLSSNSVAQPSSNLQPPGAGNGQSYYNSFERGPGVQERNSQPDDVYSAPAARGINASSQAVTKFAVSLLKTIEGQRDGNIVTSPFSIAALLALLQQGALGATQQQISSALGIRPDDAADAFKQFTEHISRRSSRNILRMANNIFVADSFVLNSLFRRVAVQSFGSDVTPAKFSRAQEAVQTINAWVAEKTNNNIQNILAPDAVDQNTQLVLVNTVYFKGIWQEKFKAEQTIQRAFHSGDGRSKMVPMMRQHRMLKTGVDRTNNAQVIFLPFEGEQYSLLVVLPSKVSSLRALVSNLSEEQLQEYLNFTPKEVTLELPKFTVRADTDLNPPLRKLGITSIFGSKSELSGLGMFENYSPQVSSAVHSAMLAIDEQGGTAAASTAFAAVALSYDDSGISFKVHRPFLAVLWDHQNGLPLFMACIYDPTA